MYSVESLKALVEAIKNLLPAEKLKFLNQNHGVKESLSQFPLLMELALELPLDKEIVLKSILAVGQASIVFSSLRKENKDRAKYLLGKLVLVEKFYNELGGLIGYHYKVMQLMHEKQQFKKSPPAKADFARAPGLNLVEDPIKTKQAELDGISNLGLIAEVYPVGGAGDRLGLVHDERDEPLPAACLAFCGRTLLESLIRDLEAREYLYFKLYGKELITPIALMTSHEKNNHEHIIRIFDENNWFGRPKESFFFFIQPLVPVITENGHWIVKDEFNLVLKPGGHGVIWKLAYDHGVFSWLENLGRKKVLVRQINNPIAGTNGALLAFMGTGCKRDKAFGFLSCERRVGSAEGVLVLMHTKQDEHCYRISNLEYTDFEKYGILDHPEKKDSIYSHYPSNTNVLFADIYAIQKAMEKCRVPGLLINLRKTDNVHAGRLESTMQNIADHIETCFKEPLPLDKIEENLDSFIVYNEREKTISVTKNSYVEGKNFLETPESAFFDLLKINLELLSNKCSFKVPGKQSPEEYLKNGPNALFLFHPALGPLHSIISQKLRHGFLHESAELQIELAEVDIENLELNGSLLIFSKHCKNNQAKCLLKNVRVENRGRKKEAQAKNAWKNKPLRDEALLITLHGNGEFEAQDVVFKGNFEIEVPDGTRITAYQDKDKVMLKSEPITSPSWSWSYSIVNHDIILQK